MSGSGGFSGTTATAQAGASRQLEVLKAQQYRRRGSASASVRQQGGSVSKSVQWRSQMTGASGSASGQTQRRGRPVAFRSSAGGFEGDRGVVFPQSSILSQRQEGQVAEQEDHIETNKTEAK